MAPVALEEGMGLGFIVGVLRERQDATIEREQRQLAIDRRRIRARQMRRNRRRRRRCSGMAGSGGHETDSDSRL